MRGGTSPDKNIFLILIPLKLFSEIRVMRTYPFHLQNVNTFYNNKKQEKILVLSAKSGYSLKYHAQQTEYNNYLRLHIISSILCDLRATKPFYDNRLMNRFFGPAYLISVCKVEKIIFDIG